MKIRKLQIENFRNHKKYEYIFSDEKNITILTGENGIGKTNFLEAIYLLSLGRSFRTLKKEKIVMWGEDFYRCKGEFERDGDAFGMENFFAHSPSKKQNFKVDGVKTSHSDFIGNFLTVLFYPEDLNILYLSPSYRRKYMDVLLSQTDKFYLNALSSYKKTMKQRNALLQEIRGKEFRREDCTKLRNDLEVWNKQLLLFGSELIQKRLELIEFLRNSLTEVYDTISGGDERIKVSYIAKVKNKEEYELMLNENNEQDILAGRTSIGPHLDDIEFKIDGIKIGDSASRGEYRTLLLAIKLAETVYIKEKTGEKPVLLLDDVFSELDTSRQKQLLNVIKDFQTIITTTDYESMEKELRISENSTLVKL